MRIKTKTCFAIVAAGALMALSSSVRAQQGKSPAVKLSDAELDQITAGQVTLAVVQVFNPGKADIENRPGNHVICINCNQLEVSRAFGAVFIVTPNGKTVSNPIGKSPF